MNKVYFFDTTLRDGEQSPGIALNAKEKLEIAEQLARLNVDIIEAGFPRSSEGDFEAVKQIAMNVKGPVIAGLARALDKDIDVCWEAIKNAGKPRIHTFISSSDTHIKYQLNKTKDEVLEMAVRAVMRARSYCDNVEFSAMDATRSDKEFLYILYTAVIEAGATSINVPDTVGYALPDEFGQLIRDIRANVKGISGVDISVHCHNDLGLAVANSIAAIEAGANQVECAINGLGERAGNAALEEIAMILDTRKNSLKKEIGINTKEIAKTSRLVSFLTGYNVQPNKAIVGANAFAHESGIHQDGVIKRAETYEIMDPKRIGLEESTLVLGKHSGRHAVKKRLEDLGYDLPDSEIDKIFEGFKSLADKKREVTDRDLEAMVASEMRSSEDVFTLDRFVTHSHSGRSPHAEVTLRTGDGAEKVADSEGDGQVDAACRAIDKITGLICELVSFNVASISGGIDAVGDVTIRLVINGRKVVGRGMSTDIVEASIRAYVDAMNKYFSIGTEKKKSIHL